LKAISQKTLLHVVSITVI